MKQEKELVNVYTWMFSLENHGQIFSAEKRSLIPFPLFSL